MKHLFALGVISLVIFLYILEVTFFRSPKVASHQRPLKHERFWYRKRLYAHMASINNKHMVERFTDLHLSSEQAILDAMEEELKELESFGIDVDDFEDRPLPEALKRVKLPAAHISMVGNKAEVHRDREAHDKDEATVPVTEASMKTNAFFVFEKTEGNFTRALSRRFRVRNPDVDDLQKLTKKGIDFERETDPLSESTYCERQVFLTILVISQPKSVRRRRFIRDTWAHSYEEDYKKHKGKQPFPDGKTYLPSDVVRVVFIIGQSMDVGTNVMQLVREESRLNKDIVFGNMAENYRNLTMKTKLGLKWAFYECKTSYVLKTDDDVFVNPVVLVEWLKEIPKTNLYTGWCNYNSPVVRDERNKWYISYEDYKEEKYPGYCLGGGYLMSSDVLASVVKLSFGRLLFPMEDLYVGLIIRELEGVQPRDERKHFNLVYNGKTANDCDMNSIFLLHRVVGQNLITHMNQSRNAIENC